MIISHRYKFIYLKGHKVAGSSLSLALGKFCGSNDSVNLPGKKLISGVKKSGEKVEMK